MKIDLTKDQCEALANYIDDTLLDEIRNNDYIDSIEWLANIVCAWAALDKGAKGGDGENAED